jgi:hypothetical protein
LVCVRLSQFSGRSRQIAEALGSALEIGAPTTRECAAADDDGVQSFSAKYCLDSAVIRCAAEHGFHGTAFGAALQSVATEHRLFNSIVFGCTSEQEEFSGPRCATDRRLGA